MRILPAALLVGALTATPASGQPKDGPSTLSRDWKRLPTPNLTVVGNARESDLQLAAEEIERFRGALTSLSPSLRLDSPLPLTVVVFRDHSDFDTFKPRYRGKVRDDVAGYFLPLPHANYIAMAPTGNRQFTYHVTFHEYTHYVINRNFKRLPFWLNEGLADFYGTFAGSEKDGRTIIGRPVMHYIRALNSGTMLPLATFVSPVETERLFRDQDGTLRMYAQSWALTHFLLMGKDGARRKQLARFIDVVSTGRPPDKAFVDLFGPDLASLDRELTAHVRQFRLPALRVEDEKVKVDAEATAMIEADALQIQADLLVSMGAFDEAESRLARALTLDPRHVMARLTRARQRVGEDRIPDALDIVSADDIAQSPEFTANFTRAEVLRAKDEHAAAIPAYKRAIQLNPESAFAYYGMSLAQLAAGDPLAAASFTMCITISPSAGWYQARQIEGMRLGVDRFVISDATNYLNLAGWQGDHGAYVMFPAVLTHLREGRTDVALARLDEIDQRVEKTAWPAAVVALMRGTMTPDALIDKAGRDSGLLTEAHAYAGILASIAGRREEAIGHLEWVKTNGRKTFIEYKFALGELRRLGVQK
jgi:tetratricopeptide (TPR) repeat protein